MADSLALIIIVIGGAITLRGYSRNSGPMLLWGVIIVMIGVSIIVRNWEIRTA